MIDYLNLLEKANTRVVILSRSRFKTITTHKLMPFATLVVPTSEFDDYDSIFEGEIIAIPDAITGIGNVRNWILNHFTEETIIMADDDISYVRCAVGENGYNLDYPEDVFMVLYQALICAKDLGVGFFGFNQTNGDVRKYNASEPFKLNSWAGGVIGVIGRDISFSTNKFKTDIDFVLRNLLTKRIVWIDQRYSFTQIRVKNKGGNSKFRTQAKVDMEIAKLKTQWKGHFRIANSKSGERVNINVKRRQ